MNPTPWSNTYTWIKDVTGIRGCKGHKDPIAIALHRRLMKIGSNMFLRKLTDGFKKHCNQIVMQLSLICVQVKK